MDGMILNTLRMALTGLAEIEERQNKRIENASANELEDLCVRLSLARITIGRALDLKLAGYNPKLIQSAMLSASETRSSLLASYDTVVSLRYFSGRGAL